MDTKPEAEGPEEEGRGDKEGREGEGEARGRGAGRAEQDRTGPGRAKATETTGAVPTALTSEEAKGETLRVAHELKQGSEDCTISAPPSRVAGGGDLEEP